MKRDMKVACVCVWLSMCMRVCVKWSILVHRLTFEPCLKQLSAASYSLAAGPSNQNHNSTVFHPPPTPPTHTHTRIHTHIEMPTYLELKVCLAMHFLCILTCDCDNVQMTAWIWPRVCVCVCVSMYGCVSLAPHTCPTPRHCVDTVITGQLVHIGPRSALHLLF